MQRGRALLLAACLLSSGYAPPAPAGDDPAATAAARIRLLDARGAPVVGAVVWFGGGFPPVDGSASQAVIEQVDKAFIPQTTVIRAGTRVQFPNRDAVSHHVYSFARPNAFELPLYDRGEAPSVRFEHAGVATLGCNIHDQMVGYLVVVDSPHYGITDEEGYAQLDTLVPADGEVSVWSPRLDPTRPVTARAAGDAPGTVRVARRQRAQARPLSGSLAWEEY